MELKTYLKTLDGVGKERLAATLGTSVAYLYQLSGGHRKAGAQILFKIKAATRGKVNPQDLRDDLVA